MNIRQCKKATYTALLIEGKLPDYLADVNEQAENFLTQTAKEMAKAEGVDEAMKRRDPLGYVQRMNNISNCAEEIVLNNMINNLTTGLLRIKRSNPKPFVLVKSL